MSDVLFSYVLRPFSLGMRGMAIVVGLLPDGSREAHALVTSLNGQSDVTRLEFPSTVAFESVIEEAQVEAQNLMSDPSTPLVWIRSIDTQAMNTELGAVYGAVELSQRTVKSPELLERFATVCPVS
jgi:hypothetical protein